MSFARPELLGLALVLPALIAAAVWAFARRRRRLAERLADSPLLGRLGAAGLTAFPWTRLALLGSAAAAVGLAAAGPQWGRRVVEQQSEALNVVLALDVSKSMLATDIAPSRLERQQLLVRRLLRELGGDRFGLVVFAGRAYILSPLTIDHSAIGLYLDALDPGIVSQGGSSLQSAVLQATDLARGAEGTAGDRAVLLITDGEALEDVEGIRQAAARAASAGVRIYTVGVATVRGAPVPDVDPETGRLLGYKRDESGVEVVSQLGDDLLRGIADRTDGEYYHIEDGDVVARLARALGGLERSEAGAEQRTEPRDRSGLFLGLALLLLATDTLASRRPRAARTARLHPAAVALAVLALGFGIGDLERGNRHYRAGRHAEAVAAYRAALEGGRGSPQLHYNLGTALLATGRMDEAESHLKQALAGLDPELRQRALYNLGNRFLTTARQGGETSLQQFDAAVEAYKQALRIAPGDAAAKWNLELALREREEQERRTPPPPEPQEEQAQDQDPQEGGGGGGQQPQQSGGEGEQAGSANEMQPMTPEQAERILSAAEEDERDLAREKLRRGQRPTPVLRDW